MDFDKLHFSIFYIEININLKKFKYFNILQELAVVHGLSLAAKILHCSEFASVVSNIDESIYCAEAADFFTQSLECSLKEALFSLRKSSQTFVGLDPAIHQIEKLKGKLFRKMYECVRGDRGMKIEFKHFGIFN